MIIHRSIQITNWSNLLRLVSIFLCLWAFVACEKDTSNTNSQLQAPPYTFNLPLGFPTPEIPEDNPMTLEKIALGKMLFFDPILSRDSSISCGSCHFQEVAFTDSLPISIGIEEKLGFRNTATLANVAYHPYLFKDGGVPNLERQVAVPIEDETEMGFTMLEAVQRLAKHPHYPTLIQEAFGREVDAFAITRAIACFERTLISGNSPYDQYQFQGNATALNSQEQTGLELFFSERTQCSSCHSGFNFTNYDFVNNGLYTNYTDLGRYRITFEDNDKGKFKIPTLRNIAQTAPYMHDGSLPNLEEVVAHYNTGGTSHPNKDTRIKPLNLSAEEQEALIAFLHSLTDEHFLLEESFKP